MACLPWQSGAQKRQELDYDRLSLTVETDGTVGPEDAVAYAARILQDQLSLFVHFADGGLPGLAWTCTIKQGPSARAALFIGLMVARR